jgi:hypothetical protein
LEIVTPLLLRFGPCGTGVHARFRLQPVFGPAFMPGKPNRVKPWFLRMCDVNPVYGVPAQESRFKLRTSREPINNLSDGVAASTALCKEEGDP